MTSRALLRTVGCTAREAVLLTVAALLHLAALIPLARLPDPFAAPPAPELIVADLTVDLALAEAEEVSAPPPVPENLPGAPLPFTSEPLPAFLTDPADGIPMPAAAESVARILPEQAAARLPEIPAPEAVTRDAVLPEITLPPPVAVPAGLGADAASAGGATARVEHPRLTLDQAAIVKYYPKRALEKGWEGAVTVEITLDADSRVESLRVIESSGRDVLDRAARDMLRTAPYAGGPGTLVQTIRFSLRD